jgi:hypothetical protein
MTLNKLCKDITTWELLLTEPQSSGPVPECGLTATLCGVLLHWSTRLCPAFECGRWFFFTLLVEPWQLPL